jgi:hypothetical protein
VLDAENEKREIDGLLEAMRFFGFTEGSVITLNQADRKAVSDLYTESINRHHSTN